MESFIAKPGYQGLTRIIKAAGYSAKGFRAARKYESAFRQEVVLTVALIPFAFWLGRDPVEIVDPCCVTITCGDCRASQFRDRICCRSYR
jgi:diacylglycerol kinase